MARRAIFLRPDEAKNEGQRRLRELLRRETYGKIAGRLRVDESSVRQWATGRRKPHTHMRVTMREVLGWDESIWDVPPARDAYVVEDPATTKRRDES